MSRTWDISGGVLTLLEDREWEVPASQRVIERKIIPSYDKDDLKKLTVCVSPRPQITELIARGFSQDVVTIDVGIMRKVDQKGFEDQVEELLTITESTAVYLNKKELAGLDAQWLRTNYEPHFSPEHLQRDQVFVSVISLEYVDIISATTN